MKSLTELLGENFYFRASNKDMVPIYIYAIVAIAGLTGTAFYQSFTANSSKSENSSPTGTVYQANSSTNSHSTPAKKAL